ncbi:hypothetical protein AUC68_14985 [Methyloceanibacter methanicus]|uniref:Uncharacterized protein n=1 Tax=Methyloceanibacter methanicus TaxID=1774968 RepID=A0A1E3W430_9HYPH|nr:hypothetical protein [Methyloceanibacter methanicus]ODS00553.1 hypothetical protein AUC68_14985 [Methyloceanibacter methanicus]
MTLRARREEFSASSIGVAALIGSLAAFASGCTGGFSGPEQAIKDLTRVDYGKPYIGMSKEQVISCAGQPRSRIPASGGAETLVYHYNGAGPVPGGTPKDAACTASLTFEGGKLIRVSYAHKEGRSPYAWQAEKNPEKKAQMKREEAPSCVFSLPRCPG